MVLEVVASWVGVESGFDVGKREPRRHLCLRVQCGLVHWMDEVASADISVWSAAAAPSCLPASLRDISRYATMVFSARWVLMLPLVQHCGALSWCEALPPCFSKSFNYTRLPVTDEVNVSQVALVECFEWWFPGTCSTVSDDGRLWFRTMRGSTSGSRLGSCGPALRLLQVGTALETAEPDLEQDAAALVQHGRPRATGTGRGRLTRTSRSRSSRRSRTARSGSAGARGAVSPIAGARFACSAPLDTSWILRARQFGCRLASLVRVAPSVYRARLEEQLVGGVVLRLRRCLRRALLLGEALTAGRAAMDLTVTPPTTSSTRSSVQQGGSAGHVDESAPSFVASVVGMHLGLLDEMTNRAAGLALQATAWPSEEFRLHELVPELRQVVTYGLRLGEHDEEDDAAGSSESETGLDGDEDPAVGGERILPESDSPCLHAAPSAGADELNGVGGQGEGGAVALAVPHVESLEPAEAVIARGPAGLGADPLQPPEEDDDGSSLVQTGPSTPLTSGSATLGAPSALGSSTFPPPSLGPASSTAAAGDEDVADDLVAMGSNVLPSISHGTVLDGVDDTLHHLWSTGETAVLEWLTAGLLQQGSQNVQCGHSGQLRWRLSGIAKAYRLPSMCGAGALPSQVWQDWFSVTMAHVSAVETRLRGRGVANNWADPRVQQLNFDGNGNNVLDEDPLNSAHGPVDDGESDVSSLMGRKSVPSRSGDGEHPWRRPDEDASSPAPAATRPRSSPGTSSGLTPRPKAKPQAKPKAKPSSSRPATARSGDSDRHSGVGEGSRPSGIPTSSTWSTASSAGLQRHRKVSSPGECAASGAKRPADCEPDQVIADYNKALKRWCSLLGMHRPVRAAGASTDDADYMGVLIGTRGEELSRHFQTLDADARLRAMGHFMVFLSALMQEVWVLMTHTVEPADVPASSQSRPPQQGARTGSGPARGVGTRTRTRGKDGGKEGVGARPTSSTTPTTSPPGTAPLRGLPTMWPSALGVVDGSGSDVEVEVDGDALAGEDGAASAPSEASGERVVGHSVPLAAPLEFSIDLMEEGEEEHRELDPVLVDQGRVEADDDTEDDVDEDDVSHMQVSGTTSLAPAIQPVGFAMVLDTLSRALERLVDGRRRLVSGLLLRRLRGRPHAVTSLTGQMLEALLVTFEPVPDTRLEDSAEADLSWASYWWDVVATHLPEAADVPHTVVDSAQSEATCPVLANSAQLVTTRSADVPDETETAAECGCVPGAQNAARPVAMVEGTTLPSASAGVALVGAPVVASHGGPASFAVELVVRPGGSAGAGLVAGSSGSPTTSVSPPPSESVAAAGTGPGSTMEVSPVRGGAGAVQPALAQGGVTEGVPEGPAVKKSRLTPTLPPGSASDLKVTVRVEW